MCRLRGNLDKVAVFLKAYVECFARERKVLTFSLVAKKAAFGGLPVKLIYWALSQDCIARHPKILKIWEREFVQ